MRRGAAVLAAVLAACTLAGCGSRTLHARYQAERLFWHAQRAVSRLQLNPRLAGPRDHRAAERAFAEIVRRFPAAAWAESSRFADPYALDVAVLSGRAAVALARLAEMQGRAEEALAAYERAGSDYRSVLPVAVEAALGRARALERLGRLEDAESEWAALAARHPFVDPQNGQAIESVMDAPLRAADYARDRGRLGRADSLAADAASRYRAALERERGKPAAAALWLRLANAERRRGRVAEASAALRAALTEPALGPRGHEVVYALGELWLAAGAPDSALAYVGWLEAAWPERAGAQALMLRARALEARGDTPGALAAYQSFVDRFPQLEGPGAAALLRRGALFESQDRWELAKAEYHTLTARFPAAEESMEAMLRECAHYLGAGDSTMARIEARRSAQRLDRLIEQFHDTGVEMLARRTQADLHAAIADWPASYRALAELWKRYGSTPLGEAAAFRAARMAAQQLRDPAGALRLYDDLARNAPSERGRAAAREQAGRLAGGPG